MKDEWVTAALSNDAIVVDILFHLKQSSSSSSSEPTLHPLSSSTMCLPFGWGHRQPRSKPPISSSFKKDSAMTTSITRCSPTTPLSWSGGGAASPSDGAYEDSSNSSRPSSFDPYRSKGSYYTNEAPNSAFKKLRKKKKTFSELKEEEDFRLKERVHLKRELAMMHVTVEEQKARRENLKRIKVDMNINSSSYPTTTTTTTTDVLEVPLPMEDEDDEEASTTAGDNVATPPSSLDFPGNTSLSSSSSPTQIHNNYNNSSSKTLSQHHHHHHHQQQQQQQQKRHFVLPDLNMMPSEDEIMTVP